MTVAVYLHGVGGPPEHWAESIAKSPNFDGVVTREILYNDLVGLSGNFGEPDQTPPELLGHEPDPSKSGPWGSRAAYAKRQGELRRLVNSNSTTVDKPKRRLPTFLPGDALVRMPALNMRDAGHYRYNPEVRTAVLERVGNELDAIKSEFGDRNVVLLAHSFGSVVALDLLHSTPIDLSMLVTFGSPLGVNDYWSPHWQGEGKFPYGRLGSWMNMINLRDPISWQRGVSSRFPQAVDAYVRIGDRMGGLGGYHDPGTYLSSELFGEALKAVDNLNANR